MRPDRVGAAPEAVILMALLCPTAFLGGTLYAMKGLYTPSAFLFLMSLLFAFGVYEEKERFNRKEEKEEERKREIAKEMINLDIPREFFENTQQERKDSDRE